MTICVADGEPHPFVLQPQGLVEVPVHASARIVADIAAQAAAAVDRNAVFPTKAIAAAKEQRLLSLLIPPTFGGAGASLSEVADVCYILGQSCASAAMVIAMHQAALACIIRHHGESLWHKSLLRRVAKEQLLLASSTTEGAGGGNVRSSDAALERDGETIRFRRAATVMSYGAQADGIVSTARRNPEAAASDQQLIVLLKQDYSLVATGAWDTLGMRGTCSSGFALDAVGATSQVISTSYAKIHQMTMVPVSHLMWAAVWTGVAAAAVSRAQLFVRAAARRAGGQMPPGAGCATRASACLHSLRTMLAAALAEFERLADDEARLASPEIQAALNLFKVEASERALNAVMEAMRASGLAGYRNDGDHGIGRHLRDVLSAPVMVHNERILASMANVSLIGGVPASLFA